VFTTLLRPLSLLRNLSKPGPRQTGPRFFRPRLLALEDRIVLDALTWVGPAGGKWSTPANWSTLRKPLEGDTLIFGNDGGGVAPVDTDSEMDMGAAWFHVTKLVTYPNYKHKITLDHPLYVDVLDFNSSAGKIAGPGLLGITQQTVAGAPVATLFATSYWKAGHMDAELVILGEEAHKATLNIGGNTPVLNNDLTIKDAHSTVNWVAGNIFVEAGGKTVTNFGTFRADSPGAMGNALAPSNRWFLKNHNELLMKRGKFLNGKVEDVGPGETYKKVGALLPEDDVFTIVGEFLQDDAGSLTSIESGTLIVTGTFTQSAGQVNLDPGTSLSVSDVYSLSGGTMYAYGYQGGTSTLLDLTNLDQSGGTFTVGQNSTLLADAVSVGGGTLVLSGGAIGTSQDAATVAILSGGTFDATGTLYGYLYNDGTINPGGVDATGTLVVNGDYTQTATGTLNVEINGLYPGHDRLTVNGLATLGGILNVSFIGGYLAYPGTSFSVLTYTSRSGTFATLNLPTLQQGRWDPRYDDPAGTFTLWVLYQ
jgi:hypothetical protein